MQKYLLPGYGETDNLLMSVAAEDWTGKAVSITILAAAVFTTLTGTYKLHGTSALAGTTFPAGMVMRGLFTAITLESGMVWVGLQTAGDTLVVHPVAEEPVAVKLGPSNDRRLGIE